MRLHDRRAYVVDELQRLGEHETVERPIGDAVADGEIGDHGRVRIARVDVEHVGLRDGAAEAARVRVALHLEGAAADVAGVLGEEALDVVAVDRRAPVEAPLRAERPAAHRAQQGRPAQAARERGVEQRPQVLQHDPSSESSALNSRRNRLAANRSGGGVPPASSRRCTQSEWA